VLLIDEFGVTERLLNQVFEGSGCLGGLAALAAADFRRPDPRWLADNYFHPAAENTWVALLEALVAQARAGGLPPLAEGLDPNRSGTRRRRDRARLTPAGSALVRARQRLRMRRQQRRIDALPPAVTEPREDVTATLPGVHQPPAGGS
jgi:hypothetical protein